MPKPNKITVPIEGIRLVRSVTDSSISFYCARRIWNKSPMRATWFFDENAPEHVIYDLKHHNPTGSLPTEEWDVITLAEALRMYGVPT